MSEHKAGLDSFTTTWLEAIREGNPSTVERGAEILT